MDQSNEFDQKNKSQMLQVWCCENCEAVHFKTENVLLNFSKVEFAELTHTVMEIYQKEFGDLEFYKLTNLIQPEDEILASQTIN